MQIHPGRGVKIGGLWYHDRVLDEDRFRQPPSRGGRHKGKWVIRSDRRDRRTVFFQDPGHHDKWHVLRWTGLPSEGEIPAFSDKTAEALLGEIRRRRLGPRPRTDAELLLVLLELPGSAIPVIQWPTMPKAERRTRSRQAAQAQAAAADRTPPGQAPQEIPCWPDQTRTVAQAVDADRHRRREAAAGQRGPRFRRGWARVCPACSCCPRTTTTTTARSRRRTPDDGHRARDAHRATAAAAHLCGLAALPQDPPLVHTGTEIDPCPVADDERAPALRSQHAPHRDTREPAAAGHTDGVEGVETGQPAPAQQRSQAKILDLARGDRERMGLSGQDRDRLRSRRLLRRRLAGNAPLPQPGRRRGCPRPARPGGLCPDTGSPRSRRAPARRS